MAKQSTTSKLKEAALKAKIEISDEIDRFIDKLDKAAADPEHSISMTEIENEWRQLSLSTHKTYSDFVHAYAKFACSEQIELEVAQKRQR